IVLAADIANDGRFHDEPARRWRALRHGAFHHVMERATIARSSFCQALLSLAVPEITPDRIHRRDLDVPEAAGAVGVVEPARHVAVAQDGQRVREVLAGELPSDHSRPPTRAPAQTKRTDPPTRIVADD